MKQRHRQHLKENELALAVGRVQAWAEKNQKTLLTVVAAVVIAGVAIVGFTTWRQSADNRARVALAEAMVIEEARVMPPAPPAGTTNDPTALGGQLPGTYPTEQAKLEASLPKFQAAADNFPNADAGILARFHLAKNLVALGRFDDAIPHYEQVIAKGDPLIAKTARLGKAEAQLRSAQYDPAIATFKEFVDAKDPALPAEALLMELGRAYKLAGKTEDARKTFTQITEQHAATPFADLARQEIEKLKS